jgi:cell division protein FtsB
MKTPLVMLFLAGAGLSVAVRSVIFDSAEHEERIVTLEDRVMTLERTVQSCCSTTHGLYPDEQAAHRAYVELKKRITKLEACVKELEKDR